MTKREEMLSLSDQALADIELSKIPLSQICLKAKRLAKLSGNEMYEKAFELEITGYPSDKLENLSQEITKIARFSNRLYTDGDGKEKMFAMGIERIESQIHYYENAPPQHSRRSDVNRIGGFKQYISERKNFIYNYILDRNIKLHFNNNLVSSKNNLIRRTERILIKYLPDGVKKINSAIENLESNNPEDWANSTTTMRRILSDLARKLEPNNNTEKYYKILKKYIKEEYKNVAEVHMKFIIDETNTGTHHKVNQNHAEKLLLHICLFLDEINWKTMDEK